MFCEHFDLEGVYSWDIDGKYELLETSLYVSSPLSGADVSAGSCGICSGLTAMPGGAGGAGTHIVASGIDEAASGMVDTGGDI